MGLGVKVGSIVGVGVTVGSGVAASDFDQVYAASITNVNLTMEIDDAGGLLFNMTTTGDFTVQDNGANLANFGDDSVITFSPANATSAGGNVLVDAGTTDSTLNSTTTGTLGLTVGCPPAAIAAISESDSDAV